MTENTPPRSFLSYRTALALGLVVHAARMLPLAMAYRDRINPDAVSYIQQASYLSQGNIWKSFSGYWSPLLSWCIAPLMALGMDGLHAAHMVMAIWGGLLVAASFLLIRRMTALGPPACLLALLLIGDGALRWGVALFPDGIMAACLLACCAFLAGPNLLGDRRSLFRAGLLGGMAYLAKSYALPFFLALLPLTIAFRMHAGEKQSPAPGRSPCGSFFHALAPGLLGFLILAGPWMTILSLKVGKPTFSLVGGINHAIVGPPDMERAHPNTDRLWTPPPGRISIWEVPETMTYNRWSPLASRPYLQHQIGLVGNNIGQIFKQIRRFDFLGLSLLFVILGPVLLGYMGQRQAAWTALWGLSVATLFASGFTLLFFSYRYTNPFLRPFCLILTLNTVFHLSHRLRSRAPRGWLRGWAPAGVWIMVLFSFAAHANLPFEPYTLEEIHGTPFNNVTLDSALHRQLAADLRAAGVAGPLASSLHWGGLYLAYHMQVPYLGTPRFAVSAAQRSSSVDLLAELDEHEASWILVASGSASAMALQDAPHRWALLRTIEPAGGQKIEIHVRREDQ